MKHTLSLFFAFALLLIGQFALNIGGGVAFAASASTPQYVINAQAKSVSTSASLAKAAVISPNTSRVACNGRTDYFEVYTDYRATIDCFANAGVLNVSLYNADEVCTGNNTGWVFWGSGNTATTFPNKYTCYWIDWQAPGAYVHVNQIGIY